MGGASESEQVEEFIGIRSQGNLAVYDSGVGGSIPVLFLHEDCGRASQWCGIRASLASRKRAIAFDFAGHGRSQAALDGDYRIETRAADVGAVADASRLDKFVIVAHGGSSAVALTFAAEHQHRVAGLFLVNPSKDNRAVPNYARLDLAHAISGKNVREVLRGHYRSMAGPNETTVARILEDADAVVPQAIAGVWQAIAQWNPTEALLAYAGPIASLVSTAGDRGAALHRMRPSIHCLRVAACGHWIQLDHPKVVARALDEFLSKIALGAR